MLLVLLAIVLAIATPGQAGAKPDTQRCDRPTPDRPTPDRPCPENLATPLAPYQSLAALSSHWASPPPNSAGSNVAPMDLTPAEQKAPDVRQPDSKRSPALEPVGAPVQPVGLKALPRFDG